VSYCGSEVVRYLSQVTYNQISLPDDAALNNFIQGTLEPAARQFIDTFCGHGFGSYHGTLTLDGNGKNVLFIPPQYSPLIAIMAGSVSGAAISPISDLKVHDQYVEWYGGAFTKNYLNVVLEGSYGYASVPKDVMYACGQLCANFLNDIVRRRNAPDLFMSVLQNKSEKGMSLSSLWASPAIMTKDIEDVLDNYRFYYVDVA
jgi:hypothetical protein